METELEKVLDEALASAGGRTFSSEQDKVDYLMPYYEKVKHLIPSIEEFIRLATERVADALKQINDLGYDVEKIIPSISESVVDMLKMPDFEITKDSMRAFLKPYWEKVKEYCPDYDGFLILSKEYYQNYFKPKNDLMSVIKECNANFRELAEKAKAEGRDYVLPDGELKEMFKPYHERVVGECPDMAYFMQLCSLDLQYNFIGGAVLSKEGSTNVEIG